jgi:hypothetical protein
VKFSELEDSSKLATRDWVEHELADLKIQLKTDRLERQSKLMNCAGLIGFGLIWGFLIAELLFLRK